MSVKKSMMQRWVVAMHTEVTNPQHRTPSSGMELLFYPVATTALGAMAMAMRDFRLQYRGLRTVTRVLMSLRSNVNDGGA